MGDRPIIMKDQMVRALLDGRKTQTRRLAWKKPGPSMHKGGRCVSTHPFMYENPTVWQKGKPGDRLWVKESFGLSWSEPPCAANSYMGDAGPIEVGEGIPDRFYDWIGITYRASFDGDDEEEAWRPSIHMPRWASRLTLVVTGVRLERLQDITDDDAFAEGLIPNGERERTPKHRRYFLSPDPDYHHIAGLVPWAFGEQLWDKLHGPGAWDENPEVVAITFTVHKANIDDMTPTDTEEG